MRCINYMNFSLLEPSMSKFTNDLDIDKEKLLKLFDKLVIKSYIFLDGNGKLSLGFNTDDFKDICSDLGIDYNKYNFIQEKYDQKYSNKGYDEEDAKHYDKISFLSYENLFMLSILKIQNMNNTINNLSNEINLLKSKMEDL